MRADFVTVASLAAIACCIAGLMLSRGPRLPKFIELPGHRNMRWCSLCAQQQERRVYSEDHYDEEQWWVPVAPVKDRSCACHRQEDVQSPFSNNGIFARRYGA